MRRSAPAWSRHGARRCGRGQGRGGRRTCAAVKVGEIVAQARHPPSPHRTWRRFCRRACKKRLEAWTRTTWFQQRFVRQITRMVVEELQKRAAAGALHPHWGLQPPCPSGPADMERPVWSGQRADGQKNARPAGAVCCGGDRHHPRAQRGAQPRARAGAPARSDAGRDLHRRRLHAGGQAPGARVRSVEGYPGIEIIGPCGSVKKDSGVIAALRHVHMTPKDAARFGVEDGPVYPNGDRRPAGAILCNCAGARL